MITDPKVDLIVFHAVRSPRAKPVVVVCSWCPGARERTLALQRAGFETTHTLCPECLPLFEKGA